MHRGYSRREYLEKVGLLQAARPGIQITGDIIVGFPGESEADFADTLSLMEEVGYADLFSFKYSVRPGTRAADYRDEVAVSVKQERLDRLQGLQRKMTLERNRSFVGSMQDILVEGVSKRGDQLFGRTSGNRVVNFPGNRALIGSIAGVNVTRAVQNSLLGELFDEG